LQHRLDVEARRYTKKYDANPYEMKNYDLVVDTSDTPIEEVVAKVTEAYQSWLAKEGVVAKPRLAV